MPTTTKAKTKKKKRKLFHDDAIAPRTEPENTGIPHREEILDYFSKWGNEPECVIALELPMNTVSCAIKRLEAEGMVESRKMGLEWRRTLDSWLSGDWLIEDKQSIEEIFWVRVSVGRKLISFEIGEDAEGLGKYAKDEIYHFEVSKRSLVSQIKKYNILPTEYAAAFINANLTPKLSLCISSGDRCLFVDDKFKILQFDEKEIEKILNVDAEIKIKEFFLLKENELNLKRGDRVNITYYQFGIFETLPNEWEFLRFKGLYAEISRGDGCGDNYQKQPLWRIQKCVSTPLNDRLDTSNSSEELEGLASPLGNISPSKSEQPDTAISTKVRSPSSPTTSQTCQSSGTSENFTQNGESTTYSASHSPAPAHPQQATAKASHIQKAPSGEKDSGLCAKSVPNMQSGNNLWELSIADYEQSLADAEWLDIKQKLKLSRQEASARHISAAEFSSLPTLTANQGTGNHRPAGASKCERKFAALGLLPNGLKLSPQAMSMFQGFPANWCEVLTLSEPSIRPVNPEAKDGSKAESSSVKPSRPLKPESHSHECATSKGSQETNINILPTPPTRSIVEIAEIELLSGEKHERWLSNIYNHLVDGAPPNRYEVGAIAYILKEGASLRGGEFLKGKITRIFDREYWDKCAVGDLVAISPKHPYYAGKIYEVARTQGGFIVAKDGYSFNPKQYERFDPVGRKLKVSVQHPTLGDRIIECESYKDGYIKMVGGGLVALEMISISHQLSVTSHQLAATILDELTLTQTILNHGNTPCWDDLEYVALGLDEEIEKFDPPHEHPAFKSAISLLEKDRKIERRGNEIRLSVIEPNPVQNAPIVDNKQVKAVTKAISLWQPWASLIAMGHKKFETRSWATDYRGKLLICAAKKKPSKAELDYFQLAKEDAPLGVTIAIADLTDCILMDREFIDRQSADEWDVGDWQPGRYAWKLENIIPIDPQPIRGYQGLWNVDIAPYIPPKKKRGRKPGSRNKKAAKGHLYKRKDCNSYLYEYWDNDKKKKRCLSVSANLFPTIDKAIADGESVGKIIAKIKGTSQQLNLF